MREVGLAPRFLHIDGEWRDHRIYAVTVEECPGGMVARLEFPPVTRVISRHTTHAAGSAAAHPTLGSVDDLSALIFVALAVAWAVYLIPKALQHHEEAVAQPLGRPVLPDDAGPGPPRAGQPARRAAGRQPRPRAVGADRHHQAHLAPATSPAPAPPPRAHPCRRPPRRPPPSAGARPAAGSRCSSTSCVAAFGLIGWGYVAIPARLLVAWLVACRLMVRGERAALADASARGRDRRGPGDRGADAAARRGARPARGHHRRPRPITDPSLWDPMPVTLPTYVSKPAAVAGPCAPSTSTPPASGPRGAPRPTPPSPARPRTTTGRAQGRAARAAAPRRRFLTAPYGGRMAHPPRPSPAPSPVAPTSLRASCCRCRCRRSSSRRYGALPPIREVRDAAGDLGHGRPDPHDRARRRRHHARDADHRSTGRARFGYDIAELTGPMKPLVDSLDGLVGLRPRRHRLPDHLDLGRPPRDGSGPAGHAGLRSDVARLRPRRPSPSSRPTSSAS